MNSNRREDKEFFQLKDKIGVGYVKKLEVVGL